MSAARRTTKALLKLAGLPEVEVSTAYHQAFGLAKVSRTQLPGLCKLLNFTQGAEVGVWKGAYSADFCRANPALHMRCVDPWLNYPAWKDTKNKMDEPGAEAFMAAAYATAQANLAPFNATLVRKFSAEAALEVPDGSLDFVYIDGNHVYDAVLEDLTLWAPKVRPGGIVAGHDYRHFTNKPMIHVIPAVNDYTARHHIAPWFVLAADRTPSFLWVVQ